MSPDLMNSDPLLLALIAVVAWVALYVTNGLNR